MGEIVKTKLNREYKIKQTAFIKNTVKAFGIKTKVMGIQGVYAQGKYEASNNLALFLDNETDTLYRVPMDIIKEAS